MSDVSEATCTESVGGYGRGERPRSCGRAVVEDGLCKLHLRVRDRREERDRAWRDNYDRGQALIDEAKGLAEKLGVTVTAAYNPFAEGGGGYTGSFTVDGDWLREQARRLG